MRTHERQQAHALLDMLPAEKLSAVRTLLEVMVEPLSRSLAVAPVEEEEITPETATTLDRARASLASVDQMTATARARLPRSEGPLAAESERSVGGRSALHRLPE